MAGIWNVSGIYDVNTKKITSKISFEVGQVFLAKIAGLDENQKEILLKMMDGWEFSANLEKPLEYAPKGLVRFQVEGFEDGKLKILMLPPKNDEVDNDDLIEEAAKKININIDKDDYNILKSMVKHSMPLTKDNVSQVKTIIDFKNKIASDENQRDNFINNYLSSRGIEKTSNQGEKIERFLKNFFTELKDVSDEDIFTMMENGIDITQDNIESYNKVFKGTQIIYKELGHTLKVDINGENDKIQENAADKQKNIINNKFSNQNYKETKTGDIPSDNAEIKNTEADDIKSKGEGLKDIKPKDIESKGEELKDVKPKDIGSKGEELKDIKSKNAEESKDSAQTLKLKDLHKIVSEEVKNQISVKTEEMKNTIKDIIKNIIDDKSNLKSPVYDKIMESIKSNINDFKVFNTVSNQYYYMDLPLEMNGDEYGCKLLIKDERKKVKKIDSKNVKIAASVKTVNIGTVDAYLKINNNNMNIDLKCEGRFKFLLKKGITKLHDELSTLGYNIFIDVSNKQGEVSLSGCTDFFNDSKLNVINVLA